MQNLKERFKETPFIKLILSFALVCIVYFCFKEVLNSTVIMADDNSYFIKNQFVQNFTLENIVKFFSEVSNPSTVKGYYQPITMIALMLDFKMGARSDNFYVFHLSNLILHIMNTLLIYYLLLKIFKSTYFSFIGAVMFGVHTLGVEPIAWVSEKKTLLATLFFLLSLIYYFKNIDFRDDASNVKQNDLKALLYYFSHIVFYVFSMLSKPILIFYPLILIIIDYWPLKRISKKNVSEKIPLFILTVAISMVSFNSQYNSTNKNPLEDKSLIELVWKFFNNLSYYILKLFYPVDITYFTSKPDIYSLNNYHFMFSFIFIVILTSLILISLKYTKAVFSCSALFILFILPTLGLSKISASLLHYKYTYLPSIALIILFTWFLVKVYSKLKIQYFYITFFLTLAAIVGLTINTRNHLKLWKDNITLIENSEKIFGDSIDAKTKGKLLMDKALHYYNIHKYEKSVSILEDSLALNSYRNDALILLSAIYINKNDLKKAIFYLENSAKDYPQLNLSKITLLGLYLDTENLYKARKISKDLGREKIMDSDLFAYLSRIKLLDGDIENSLGYAVNSINLNSKNSNGYHALGLALKKSRDFKKAELAFKIALEYSKSDKILSNYLDLLISQRKLELAKTYFKNLIKNYPSKKNSLKQYLYLTLK